MFKEHGYVVWGDKCTCGNECFILQNKFHPWVEKEFSIKMTCHFCGKEIEVNAERALDFYSRKIQSYYKDVHGTVIDLGCGGGFLSDYLAKNEKVNKIFAIDNDLSCKEDVESIDSESGRISFIHMDICDLGKQFEDGEADYIVSRDVFMFIEDTDKYFDDITRIVRKGIRQMGWFVSGNERMKNKLPPDDIANELLKRGWKVKTEYLDWYKSGYFIEAWRG